MASLVSRLSDLTTRIASEFNAVRASLNNYALSGHSHANVTTSAPGMMSATDKTKLNGIQTGATANLADADLTLNATAALAAFDEEFE